MTETIETTETAAVIASKLQQVLDTKEDLKQTIYKISSNAGINSALFNNFTAYLKSLPFSYDVDEIPGDIVAVYDKDDTEFNYNNIENVSYFPVGGDSDLNNKNRVIKVTNLNLNLKGEGDVLKLEDHNMVPNKAAQYIRLSYSDMNLGNINFSTDAKELIFNSVEYDSSSIPPWSIINSPNLERLHGPNVRFYNNGKKVVFKNLPKLTYLSVSGAAETFPKLSTLYTDCPELETIVVNLTAVESPGSFDQYKNYEIFDTSINTLHLVINGNNSESYLQGIIKPVDISIYNLILESNNTDNTKTELYLYPNDGYSYPELLTIKDLEIVRNFDCCLGLGNFNDNIKRKLPELLRNLKYNTGNTDDRYVILHPSAYYDYSDAIRNEIKTILDEKNWSYEGF